MTKDELERFKRNWKNATPEQRKLGRERRHNNRHLFLERHDKERELDKQIKQMFDSSISLTEKGWKDVWEAIFERAVNDEDTLEVIQLSEILDGCGGLQPRPNQEKYEKYCYFLLRFIKAQVLCHISKITNKSLQDKMLAIETTGAQSNLLSVTRMHMSDSSKAT